MFGKRLLQIGPCHRFGPSFIQVPGRHQQAEPEAIYQRQVTGCQLSCVPVPVLAIADDGDESEGPPGIVEESSDGESTLD